MAHKLVSLLSCGKRGCDYLLCRSSATHCRRKLSSSTTTLGKVANTIRNDPFVKLSLSLCALIIGGTLVMELYNRLKKKSSTTMLMLPPGFAHHSVRRESLLNDIRKKMQKQRSMGVPPILYVTGPSGSGKTELVRQFCSEYGAKKWFGLKSIPAKVVCIDATSPETLQLSLSEVAGRLGVKPAPDARATLKAVLSQLSSNHLPWLLVVDHLTESTQSSLEEFLESEEFTASQNPGAMLITTNVPCPRSQHTFQVSQRLSEAECLELLKSLSGLHAVYEYEHPSVSELLHDLQYHPMAVALAAATMKIYGLSGVEGRNIFQLYQELLKESVSDHSGTLDATLALYCEAAESDSRLRHSFDMLGSCDTKYPLPVAAVAHHLCSTVYAIPDEALAPPALEPILAKLKPAGDSSYWSQIKSAIPFLRPDAASDERVMKVLAASQDQIAYLRDSPILLFKSVRGSQSDFEFVSLHALAARQIPELFANHTIPRLDQDHVEREAVEFQQSAWLKKFRTFDEKKSRQKFHQTLPGVSSPGVLTEAQFHKSPWKRVQAVGTQIPDPLSYGQYLHIVSHYHRVLTSLNSYLQWCKGEMDYILIQQSLAPHFQAIKSFPLSSQADKLSAELSLLAIKSLGSAPESRKEYVAAYERLIADQRRLLGADSPDVAASLVDYANLHLSLNDASSALKILEAALIAYKKVPSAFVQGQLALDMSHALSSMGLAYSQLGKKTESKGMYEHALATAQSVPPNGKVSLRQRQLVASLLVDVTHAYLTLGDLAVAKKYCELASFMLQTVYPQGHMETVRLFNINSIVNALLGNREESTRLHADAVKMKAKLTT